MDILWKNEADILRSKKKFRISPKENRQTFLIVSQDNIAKIQSNMRATVKVKDDVILRPRKMLAVEVIGEERIQENRTKILKKKVFLQFTVMKIFSRFWFQQDGAKAHTVGLLKIVNFYY